MTEALYDRIGRDYSKTRRPDPRIAAAICRALDDAASVLNVGAGAGSYEPADRNVVGLEPSAAMIAQRPADAAPVIQGYVEQLPFYDNSFDAVLAVATDHHWRDRQLALSEIRRVARKRIVIFNADPGEAGRFWLTREYLPGSLRLIPPEHRPKGAWRREIGDALGRTSVQVLPIPADCKDGFYKAFWRRPAAYLHPGIRAGISVFARLEVDEVTRATNALRDDLASGAWARRNGGLLAINDLDLGYVIITSELRQ